MKVFVLGIAAFLSISTSLSAVVMKKMNSDELLQASEFVVGGIVDNVKSKIENDGDIYTTLKLRDSYVVTEEGILTTKKKIKVRFWGGQIVEKDNYGEHIIAQRIEGMPYFSESEEVILFLNGNGMKETPFVGYHQGIYYIDENGNLLNSNEHNIANVKELETRETGIAKLLYTDENGDFPVRKEKDVVKKDQLINYLVSRFKEKGRKPSKKDRTSLYELRAINENHNKNMPAFVRDNKEELKDSNTYKEEF